MLMHTTSELEALQTRASDAQRTARAGRKSALAQELWLPEFCDASITLRSSQLLVLGGLRMPRSQRPGASATGLSPGLAVLRQIGDAEQASHARARP